MKPFFFVSAYIVAVAFFAACSGHSTVPSTTSTWRATESQRSSVPHVIAEYPISGMSFQVLGGSDGNIWFPEVFADKIGRLTPNGMLSEFAVPIRGLARFATLAPDGNIWFTLANTASGGYLGSITPQGVITLHALPTTGPRFVTTGPDGNLWYTDDSNVIGRYSFDGAVSTYEIPTANSQPRGITTGADGNLWFVEFASNQIGKVTTTGAFTEYRVPAASGADWLVDGKIWFIGNGNSFGTITPGGHAAQVAMPDVPGGLLRGGDGRIWFTLQSLNQIGSMTNAGQQLQTYPIPTPDSNPIGLAFGSDGNIYFSEPFAARPQIGVFQP